MLPAGADMRGGMQKGTPATKYTLFNVRAESGPVNSQRRVWVDATSTCASHSYCVWYPGCRIWAEILHVTHVKVYITLWYFVVSRS